MRVFAAQFPLPIAPNNLVSPEDLIVYSVGHLAKILIGILAKMVLEI